MKLFTVIIVNFTLKTAYAVRASTPGAAVARVLAEAGVEFFQTLNVYLLDESLALAGAVGAEVEEIAA